MVGRGPGAAVAAKRPKTGAITLTDRWEHDERLPRSGIAGWALLGGGAWFGIGSLPTPIAGGGASSGAPNRRFGAGVKPAVNTGPQTGLTFRPFRTAAVQAAITRP